jgi:NAD(P)H-hydrate epimerase
VAIASWPAAVDAIDGQAGELMSARIEPDRIGASLDEALARRSAVAIGPGLGLDGAAREVVERVVLDFPGPVVVDADAITQLSGRSALLRDAPAARVLTPHSGELARLLGTSASEIESDRFGWASRAAEETGQVVVLKGRNTIVAAAGRTPFVCTRGSAVLATAGSGDVLTGVMGALLCVAGPLDAACAAVWLHAAAADLWAARHRADRGLIASDLIAELPDAMAEARAG